MLVQADHSLLPNGQLREHTVVCGTLSIVDKGPYTLRGKKPSLFSRRIMCFSMKYMALFYFSFSKTLLMVRL